MSKRQKEKRRMSPKNAIAAVFGEQKFCAKNFVVVEAAAVLEVKKAKAGENSLEWRRGRAFFLSSPWTRGSQVKAVDFAVKVAQLSFQSLTRRRDKRPNTKTFV